jgi:peptide/nickel transport system permease protein
MEWMVGVSMSKMQSSGRIAIKVPLKWVREFTFLENLRVLRYTRHAKLFVGGAFVAIVVVVATLAPLLAPHDPNSVQLRNRLVPPVWHTDGNAEYLLGTDQLGRDLLSRIIFGSRVSLFIGLFSVLSAGALGTLLGLVAGYYGRWLDSIIMRVTDVLMAMPFIVIVLIVVALMGPSLFNVVIVFTLTSWYVYTRIARASTLSLRESQYVDAARAVGANDLRILWRHILPNLFSPLLVMASFEMARIITAEAALGFWGLGVPPPDPSWGNMLSDGREYIQDAWWISTFPGLALMITVLGMNVLGDSLRDFLDPRLRKM